MNPALKQLRNILRHRIHANPVQVPARFTLLRTTSATPVRQQHPTTMLPPIPAKLHLQLPHRKFSRYSGAAIGEAPHTLSKDHAGVVKLTLLFNKYRLVKPGMALAALSQQSSDKRANAQGIIHGETSSRLLSPYFFPCC